MSSPICDARCPQCRALLFRYAGNDMPRVEIKCRRCGDTVSFIERQKADEPPERP